MTRKSLAAVDLPSVAQRYVDGRPAEGLPDRHAVARLADTAIALDRDFCRRTATYFDGAPTMAADAALLSRYDRFKRQNLLQYQAIVNAGIEIRPWLGDAQPYRDSRHLREKVRQSHTLYVYLTSSGHGPDDGTSSGHGPDDGADSGPGGLVGAGLGVGGHPMIEPSGVWVDGVEFCHNDLFRAVHDLFGHVMFGRGFGPAGELLAAFCHMHMYSPDVRPLLLTEHVGQICWFFHGPHLRRETGELPERGDADYLPPARRPYPEQKVFLFPARFFDAFTSMFEVEGEPDD